MALAHHLVSRVTSLVAVDVTPSRPKNEDLNSTKLPLNLPEGWDFDKVFGEQTVPVDMPVHEREAMKAKLQKFASLTASKMAAAPTAKAAGIVAADNKAVDLPGAATLADLEMWIGMMLAVFAAVGMMVMRWLRMRRVAVALPAKVV